MKWLCLTKNNLNKVLSESFEEYYISLLLLNTVSHKFGSGLNLVFSLAANYAFRQVRQSCFFAALHCNYCPNAFQNCKSLIAHSVHCVLTKNSKHKQSHLCAFSTQCFNT